MSEHKSNFGIQASAVIICYNPNPELVKSNIAAIAENFSEVIVVDNFSNNVEAWQCEVDLISNVVIVNLDFNSGIGHASNLGILLSSVSSKWIGFFDQDTEIHPDYLYFMLQCNRLEIESDDVAMVVPRFDYQYKHHSYQNRGVRLVMTAIASGSLLKRAVIQDVGLFEEELFIDYVDTEFCLRLWSRNYKILEVVGVKLNHSLGNMTRDPITKLHTSNHSPIRRFFRARNRVFVHKKYFSKYPSWVIRDILRMFTENTKMLLLEGDKIKKFNAVIKGILNGIKGRYGNAE